MTASSDELGERLAVYLAHVMPDASAIEVAEFSRIHGGISQETFRFRARWSKGGVPIDRRLILRRMPAAGPVVVERDLEFTVYAALAGQGLPVPGVYWHELDPAWLDRPFFIMDLCPGLAPAIYEADPYGGKAAEVARAFWAAMGTLATIDHRAIGLDTLRNGLAPDAMWRHELDHWEATIDKDATGPEPIVRGAIRWLRAHPPVESAKIALVHGDLRSGNFLFTEDGTISALLDWEMAHIGDPLEDVAWALDSFWSIARFLPEDEGLAIWQAQSGLVIDAASLDWWRLFVMVKASALWLAAERTIVDGTSTEMAVLGSAVRAGHYHRNAILRFIEQKEFAA